MLKAWYDWLFLWNFPFHTPTKSPNDSLRFEKKKLQPKIEGSRAFSRKNDNTDFFCPSFKSIDQPNYPQCFIWVVEKNLQLAVKKCRRQCFSALIHNTEAELCWKNDKNDCVYPTFKSRVQHTMTHSGSRQKKTASKNKEAALFPQIPKYWG